MSTKTEHYQLNQYEPGDTFLRTDFNEDNAKIDAALEGKADLAAVELKCRLKTGTYIGDHQPSRTISVGFTPKAVLVLPVGGGFFSNYAPSYTSGGLAVEGSSANKGDAKILVSICEGGFQVYHVKDASGTNYSGSKFNYIALG